MKLIYKEDPGEWRKSALLTGLAMEFLVSLLHWRQHLSSSCWSVVTLLVIVLVIAAVFLPRWLRGWYRLSLWLGFHSSQFVGRCVLLLFFIFIITPLGCLLRLGGKDLLQLKRSRAARTYWHASKDCGPLDRLF